MSCKPNSKYGLLMLMRLSLRDLGILQDSAPAPRKRMTHCLHLVPCKVNTTTMLKTCDLLVLHMSIFVMSLKDRTKEAVWISRTAVRPVDSLVEKAYAA